MNEEFLLAVKAKLASDAGFSEAMRQAGSREAAIQLIESAGIGVPADLLSQRELNDAELAMIAGGIGGFAYA